MLKKSFESFAAQIIMRLDETAKERVFAAVQEIRNEALQTLTGSRSGREYRVPGTKRTYVASRPGEPPAVRLGGLRQSVRCVEAHTATEARGVVGTDLEYGLYQELGTKQIAPRPWLGPSATSAASRVQKILSEKWL